MKHFFNFILISLFSTTSFAQWNLVEDTVLIDENNVIYTLGKTFIFDFEIIENNQQYVLTENETIHYNDGDDKIRLENNFKLLHIDSTYDFHFEKIVMLIKEPNPQYGRTNENQTQIRYQLHPYQNTYEETGLIENEFNVWLHPIKDVFFNCLETVPFPFVQYPLEVGKSWESNMEIGEGWRGEKWGIWTGALHLQYLYTITDFKNIATPLGNLNCYKIESTASSSIGIGKLTSYFNKEYGFVRMEYEMSTGMKVNIWLTQIN